MKLALSFVLCAVAWGQKYDLNVYSIPASPTLPAAGGKITDPVFGTTIMRVTDRTTLTNNLFCYHDYPTADFFNKDNTLFHLVCFDGVNSQRYWFTFNPTTFTLGTKHTFPLDGNGNITYADNVANWSAVTPKKLFLTSVTLGSMKIWSTVDITAGSVVWTTEKTFDVSELMAGTNRLGYTSWSRDDRFAAVLGYDNGGAYTGCFVYDNKLKTVITKIASTNVHQCIMDKSGRYLLYRDDVDLGAHAGSHIVDTQNGNLNTALTDDAPDFGFNFHHDAGTGIVVSLNGNVGSPTNPTCCPPLARGLASPHTFTRMLPDSSPSHISLRNDNEATITAETERPGIAVSPMIGEIVSLFIDGSGRVIRFAHHHSTPDIPGTDSYRAEPKAVVSRDSHYITFDSTWGDQNQPIDVYIVYTGPMKSVSGVSSMSGNSFIR